MQGDPARPFETAAAFHAWLEAHHATEVELWVRIFKKGSKIPSVTWDECVVAALAWGWIDSQKRSLDEVSFLQRFTPRRAGSGWSKRNREHAERLIASGAMTPAGLAHVDAARRDGRWELAYAGSAEMVIPDDVHAALKANRAAREFFETLDRKNLFAIYHRVHTARRPETRQKRIADIVAKLGRHERFH